MKYQNNMNEINQRPASTNQHNNKRTKREAKGREKKMNRIVIDCDTMVQLWMNWQMFNVHVPSTVQIPELSALNEDIRVTWMLDLGRQDERRIYPDFITDRKTSKEEMLVKCI